MDKCLKDLMASVPAHDEPTEVTQPSNGTFDFPSLSVTAQGAAVLAFGFAPVASMGRDLLYATGGQPVAEGVAVVGSVQDEPLGFDGLQTTVLPANADIAQRLFRERDLRRTGRVNGHSQRNTLAVCQYHNLCAFPTFRLSHARPPFFAGMNVASRKASLQSSCPRSSSSPKKARQTFSHTPCSVHIFSRRQHVLGLGYRPGRSCHRAPVRRIHRMPSRHSRLLRQGRPRLLSSGKCGLMFSHCFSVKYVDRLIGFTSYEPISVNPLNRDL